MRVLSLDLSLTGTGWATGLGSEANQSAQWGVISATGRDLQRMGGLLEKISAKVAQSDLVVIEGFSFGSKGGALFEIAGFGYLVRYWLWKNRKPFVLVTPSQLKQFATGKGNSKKEIVIREVFRRWGHAIDSNDAADAVALWYLGQALVGQWKPTTAEQRKIVADILGANRTLAVFVDLPAGTTA